MQDLIMSLESLGLSRAESLVYVDVLKHQLSNGSEITKRIDLPKPSVYLALDKLYQMGLISLVPGKSKRYLVQNVVNALEKLRTTFNTNVDNVLSGIKLVQQVEYMDNFVHILGYANFISESKRLLNLATKEVYIHTNLDLNQYSDIFYKLFLSKVRVIVYSFGKPYNYNFTIEEYHDPNKQSNDMISFLAVIDYNECIISSGKANDEFLTIYTQQKLQINLLAENIHNAIYWYKLYRDNPGFTFPCRLNTLAEDYVYPSGYSI